jgi:hypothetical protein
MSRIYKELLLLKNKENNKNQWKTWIAISLMCLLYDMLH